MLFCAYLETILLDTVLFNALQFTVSKSGVKRVSDKHFCDCCDTTVIHYVIVEKVKTKLPAEVTVYDVAELFKIFGDSTRSRIICALEISEMCVCDIAALLNMSSSAISHQLRVLKQSSIVKSRRVGKVVYYSLADEHISQIFNLAFDHIMEDRGE